MPASVCVSQLSIGNHVLLKWLTSHACPVAVAPLTEHQITTQDSLRRLRLLSPMERKGKERMTADQCEAPETVQDSRWLNGVNRQLRPDARDEVGHRPKTQVRSYLTVRTCGRELSWESRYVQQGRKRRHPLLMWSQP